MIGLCQEGKLSRRASEERGCKFFSGSSPVCFTCTRRHLYGAILLSLIQRLRLSGHTRSADLRSRGSALCRENLLEGLDGDLLIAAFNPDHHLILVTDGHFQLHWLVPLHDGARGADPSVQKGLEPLIAIGREVESAVVGRNRQWDAAGEAGRAAVFMGCGGGMPEHATYNRPRRRPCLSQ